MGSSIALVGRGVGVSHGRFTHIHTNTGGLGVGASGWQANRCTFQWSLQSLPRMACVLHLHHVFVCQSPSDVWKKFISFLHTSVAKLWNHWKAHLNTSITHTSTHIQIGIKVFLESRKGIFGWEFHTGYSLERYKRELFRDGRGKLGKVYLNSRIRLQREKVRLQLGRLFKVVVCLRRCFSCHVMFNLFPFFYRLWIKQCACYCWLIWFRSYLSSNFILSSFAVNTVSYFVFVFSYF